MRDVPDRMRQCTVLMLVCNTKFFTYCIFSNILVKKFEIREKIYQTDTLHTLTSFSFPLRNFFSIKLAGGFYYTIREKNYKNKNWITQKLNKIVLVDQNFYITFPIKKTLFKKI